MTLENAVGDIRCWRLGRKKVNGSLEFNKCFIQASVIPNILINCQITIQICLIISNTLEDSGERLDTLKDDIDQCCNEEGREHIFPSQK